MKRCVSLVTMLLCVVFSFSQEFKFALITDLHLVKNNNTPQEDLMCCINDINSQDDLDFVLVLGDNTGEGDKASLVAAKATLDGLKKKYYIVSGNHETKWSTSGATAFTEVFGSERFDFEHKGFRFLGFATGPIIRMMDGHVSADDLTWLDTELSKNPTQKSIISTHYPLTAADVDNWYEVTDVLRKYNVKLILNGHYHSNRQMQYDGIPTFVNRSTLRDKSDGLSGYSIYTVTHDSISVAERKVGKNAKLEPRTWGAFSLTEEYYTTDNSEYERPDYSMNAEYPNVKNRWSVNVSQAIYASPIVRHERIYVGDDKGNFYCYNTSGEELWRFKTGDRILGTADANNKVVVVGSTDKNIYGLNVKSGKLKWQYEARETVFGSATIDKDIVYIGDSDGVFRAIDLNTGKLIWKFAEVRDYMESKPLVYEGKVIFGAWDTYMYALDKLTGQLAWKWQNPDKKGMLYSPAAVWPVGANGKVFFTAPDRVMTAVNVETGEAVWRTAESMVRETIGLSEDKQRVYSKTMQDNFVCYSATSDKAERLWITDVGYGYDHAASMPVEKDGVVFGSTKNGVIFALDGKSGALQWKHKVGNTLVGTVVPLDANSCVYVTSQGVIGVLENPKK